ncbi:MAG TPA: hypothetical protein VMW49_00640, partial [Candidatus Dormibacteraeota bacterium]|nr:hypothetical protein [Candidatus Dormibacteraeota bacterium]
HQARRRPQAVPGGGDEGPAAGLTSDDAQPPGTTRGAGARPPAGPTAGRREGRIVRHRPILAVAAAQRRRRPGYHEAMTWELPH